MRKTTFLAGLLLTAASLCQASVTLTNGTPNDSDYGVSLSPQFGTLINFDGLTPFTPLAANQYAGQGVASIASTNSSDPLTVFPYSSQSAPNYISTADFSGGLKITLSQSNFEVGFGVSESDGLAGTITAFDRNGNVLGTFSTTVPSGGATPYNAYYILEDTTSDIASVQFTTSGKFAVDDVQFAPEPESFLLGGIGLAGVIAFARSRRKNA